MSEATKRALDDALAAHIADECDGDVLTGYALVATHQNLGDLEEGITGHLSEYADGQEAHTSLGLVQHHLERMKWQLT